jgi:hypothetical protein
MYVYNMYVVLVALCFRSATNFDSTVPITEWKAHLFVCTLRNIEAFKIF